MLWYAALLVAFGQVVWHHGLIKHRSREGCFRAFKVNHWLGFTLFLGVVLAL
jgi:4-hydroxybenzoate polyprenyltransferase